MDFKKILKWSGIAFCFLLLFALLSVFPLVFVSFQFVSSPEPWILTAKQPAVHDWFVTLASTNLDSLIGFDATALVSPSVAKKAVEQAFSKPWLDAQLETSIRAYFDFANKKTLSFNAVFLLAEPKETLKQTAQTELSKLGLDPALADAFFASFPKEFPVLDEESAQELVQTHRFALDFLSQLLWVLGAVILVLVVALALLLRDSRIWLLFGFLGLLSGATLLLGTEFSKTTVSNQLSAFFGSVFGAESASFETLFSPVLSFFSALFLDQVRLFAWVFLGLGVACLALFVFFSRFRAPKKQGKKK